jgi:O-antigen ligase
LVGWAFISFLWSDAPDITLRRAINTIFSTLYGLLLFVRYPFRDVFSMLGIAFAISILASLGISIMVPSWGVMEHPHVGAWQGVFSHKNALGQASTLALVVFGMLFLSNKGWKRLSWACLIVIGLITMVFSRSATSVVTLIILVMTWYLLRLAGHLPSRLRPALAFMGISILVPIVIFLPAYLENVLSLLGKDLSLTGRVPLWEFLLPIASQKSLQGYGFGAFWRGYQGPSAGVWEVFSWTPGSAHNGYLDLWLELGVVGVVLAVGLLTIFFIRTGRGNLAYPHFYEYKFAFLFAVFFGVQNISGTLFLESGLDKSLIWILFVYLYVITLEPSRSLDKEKKGKGYMYRMQRNVVSNFASLPLEKARVNDFP